MSHTEYKRLIHAAKHRALSGFLALVQRAIQEADKNIAVALASAQSGADQSALNAARHFLRQDGNVFLRRIDALFRSHLDRAMETMYVDFRPGLRKRSIDELSLIDDDVVNHQIEVGRLAERMRDANEETIGRLNVIVARLHGSSDARERENPFRPYLLARALYEAIHDTAPDMAKTRVLFEHLANGLVPYLPGYYESIREVFEASGVRGEFEAQPSRAAHNQRYFGAPPDTASAHAQVAPVLQRLQDALQGARPVAGDAGQTASLHDVIRTMLAPYKALGRAPSPGPKSVDSAAAANPLVAQLNRHQQLAADAQPAGGDAQAEPLRLSAIREQLNLDGVATTERMTVDVVAMLFDFILEDTQIPPELRRHIAKLQVPVLKAAVLQPALLHDAAHPARQLLNRVSTAAAGADPATAAGQAMAAELDRVARKVLTDFGTDAAVFAAALREFEGSLAKHLRQDDGHATRAIEAVEAAERFSVLMSNTRNALCDVLLPMNVDKRISDFIIHVWPHVLVLAASRDAARGLAADHADSQYRPYHAALPELVWSVQRKADAQERAVLMRLLPDLVRRLRAALQLIQLPEEESRQVLDQLVVLHTTVLRAAPGGDAQALPGLDELRREFSRVAVRWEHASWELDEPPPPRDAVIDEMFSRHGVSPELRLGAGNAAAPAADRALLAHTYLLGTRVELRAADGSRVPAQLVWVSTHRSLYLFRQEQDAALVLYTCASLLDALHDQSLVPIEYAPVFERAVDALLSDTAKMPAAKA